MLRSRPMKVIGLVGVVALATSLLACSGGAAESGSATAASGGAKTSAGAKAPGGAPATGKTVEISVAMKDNVFEPKDIKVKAGDTISFIAKNEGIAIHNLMIQSSATEGKDFASAAAVNPGEDSKFTATFTKKGTVKFICAYHLPDMAGTITVE